MIIAETDLVFTPRCQSLAHVTPHLLNISHIFILPPCLGERDVIQFSSTILICMQAYIKMRYRGGGKQGNLSNLISNTLNATQIILHSQLKNIPIPAQVCSVQKISFFLVGQQWSSFYAPTSCHSAIENRKEHINNRGSSFLFHNLICFIYIPKSQSTA